MRSAVIPPTNLGREADPWGKVMQSRLVTAEKTLDRATTAIGHLKAGASALSQFVGDKFTSMPAIVASILSAAGFNITTSATVTATTGFNSTGAYANGITTPRRAAFWASDGSAGYESSSIEKKVLVDDIDLPDPLTILGIIDTYYQYKDELDKREADPTYHVQMEYGAIAEWLHDAGLWQVVVYEDGKPVSIHYDMLGLLAIRAARYVWEKHLELEARVTALETA
jgi:hypothetical protein